MNDFYTVEDLSDILKLKKYTIYEIIKRGELPCTKLGKQIRISREDFEQYCKSRKKNAGAIPVTQNSVSETTETAHHAGIVLAGQDYCIDLLISYIAPQESRKILRSYIGSYNSLCNLYFRTISMTAAHLWDGETDTYNIPFVRRLLPGVKCGMIRLLGRTQGFYVKKGNPKKIRDWSDLANDGITMINREKGCGTRILVDQKLSRLNIDTTKISGYSRESTSHLACAATVARGGADVSCGCEKVAIEMPAIDFVPLQKEWYDLVYRKDDENQPLVKQIIEIATSPAFKQDLDDVGCYETSQTGLVISLTQRHINPKDCGTKEERRNPPIL